MIDILTSKTGDGKCHAGSCSQTLNRPYIVPIVVVFTKCEALEITAKADLREAGITGPALSQQAKAEAERVLHKEFYSILEQAGHPTDQVVQLKCKRCRTPIVIPLTLCEEDMNEDNSTCAELVIVTERALKDENIAKLFLVTERVNIDQTASVAVRR